VWAAVPALQHAGPLALELSVVRLRPRLGPDLEAVQQGGLWLWFSDAPGTDNKVIVVEPGLADYVNSGSYYIEVSGYESDVSAPFTLTVRTP